MLIVRSIARLVSSAVIAFVLLFAVTNTASARDHEHQGADRVSIFSTINVGEGEMVGDVACMFCTVNLHGDLHGDLAVMFATVNSAEGRTISGDVATLFSTVRLSDNTHVHGDFAAALSTIDLAPSVVIDGDRAVLSSGLGIGIVLAPLLVLAGIIWLLVWVARRILYPGYY